MDSARIDPDLSFPDYLAHPSYGSSDIRAFKQLPALVPYRRANRDDGTDSTRLGTAAHCAILTPELFDTLYAIRPEGMDYRTKEGKAWRDSATAQGWQILTYDDYKTVLEVRSAFRNKAAAARSLEAAVHREASVFWTDRESGLPCKGRPDWFDGEAVYELKVSIVAEKDREAIPWHAHKNGWCNQLAHNRSGLKAAGHFKVKVARIVIVAPNPPYTVHLLEVRENDCDFLELDNANTRRAMAACHRRNEWPGTAETWEPIELPASAAFTESDLEGAEEVLP